MLKSGVGRLDAGGTLGQNHEFETSSRVAVLVSITHYKIFSISLIRSEFYINIEGLMIKTKTTTFVLIISLSFHKLMFLCLVVHLTNYHLPQIQTSFNV